MVDAATANFLADGTNDARLEPMLRDLQETGTSPLWDAYLAWEVACCRQPGALDAGTHIIAVVQKNAPQ